MTLSNISHICDIQWPFIWFIVHSYTDSSSKIWHVWYNGFYLWWSKESSLTMTSTWPSPISLQQHWT